MRPLREEDETFGGVAGGGEEWGRWWRLLQWHRESRIPCNFDMNCGDAIVEYGKKGGLTMPRIGNPRARSSVQRKVNVQWCLGHSF